MRSLLKCFALTYAVSWACFIAGGMLPGTFTPSFVALAITVWEEGADRIITAYDSSGSTRNNLK